MRAMGSPDACLLVADQAGAPAFVFTVDIVDVFGAGPNWPQRIDWDARPDAGSTDFEVVDDLGDPLGLLQFGQRLA